MLDALRLRPRIERLITRPDLQQLIATKRCQFVSYLCETHCVRGGGNKIWIKYIVRTDVLYRYSGPCVRLCLRRKAISI